jgi:hypothetical protein
VNWPELTVKNREDRVSACAAASQSTPGGDQNGPTHPPVLCDDVAALGDALSTGSATPGQISFQRSAISYP